MDGGRRQGRTNEELFMQQQSTEPETPTVGPLRINKQGRPTASPQSSNTSSPQPVQYPYTKPPTSPPSRPLPYPDDRASYFASNDHQERASPSISQPHPSSRSGTPSSNAVSYPSPPRQSSTPLSAPSNADRPESGLFQRMPQRLVLPHQEPLNTQQPSRRFEDEPQSAATEFAHQYYPPPNRNNPYTSSNGSLRIPNPVGVNRLASTASVSTTRAARGSPPPPETPAVELPAGGIEARYAAAGISGQSTLNSLQAQRLAAIGQQPQPASQPSFEPPRRPWTPTEEGDDEILTFQGNDETTPTTARPGHQSIPFSSASAGASTSPRPPRVNPLEQDMQNLAVSDEPPPAYSSLSNIPQGYPAEKTGGPVANQKAQAAASAAAVAGQQSHPAFANEQAQSSQQAAAGPSTTPLQQANIVQTHPGQTPSPAPGRASPPPMPEGWMAHLDPGSGQYYYIHLPTQSTQWEFPKGPTPLNLNEPPLSPTGTFVNPFASPTASTFSKPLASPGLASPGFAPQDAKYRESMMSMQSMQTISSPTAAGFSALPPTAGVDQYRVAPTNGVYFGPYLRYTNMDVDNGIWFGSIMLVTDAPHPPTIHMHQSVDLSPNPRQLKANHIYQHRQWSFYRYDIDLRMEEDHDAKWTYAITSHLGCTRYEFLVAGRYETSWRFIAHSGNDFALNVNSAERQKLGGIGYMWRDILQKHQEANGYHCQLGIGNQIYADRIWKEVPLLRQWTTMSGKENRKNAQWTAQHEEEVIHAYFHFYSSHLDQPHLREAFAQIPHVLTLDDHDIFDGFGSYPDYMQYSNMFKNIGRIGIEMYLLFQHHTTNEILRNVSNDLDLFTVTGTGWHFVKYLGPAVVVVGPDCRSERTQNQVMAGPTYQGLFPKIAVLPPSVQHCIWLIPVPIVYPRLDAAEQFAQTFATGKKAVTGTFNAVSKITSGVAGIVGAKGVVGEGFNSVKKAVGKSGLMSNVLSPFGEIDLLDELRDQWTHESKDLERTYLIRTLQGIAHNKSLRMSFFSGAANCCGAGLVHDPARPQDHKMMYQIISSSVVNAPPSQYILRMLHPGGSTSSSRPLYVPQNGHRSPTGAVPQPTDTKEDMLDIFAVDVNNQPRELKRLMGRRNYISVVSYDPQVVSDQFGKSEGGPGAQGQVSLAVDFFVQADAQAMGSFAPTSSVKYGPVVIPSLDYGR